MIDLSPLITFNFNMLTIEKKESVNEMPKKKKKKKTIIKQSRRMKNFNTY